MPEPIPFRTLIKFTFVAALLICILAYVVFQARHLITGPQIVLIDEAPSLQNERQIFLTGVAYNISRLWLNDRPIYTDAQGNFKEAFVLENGYTVTTLRAEDRYGRETIVNRSYVYSPASFIQ